MYEAPGRLRRPDDISPVDNKLYATDTSTDDRAAAFIHLLQFVKMTGLRHHRTAEMRESITLSSLPLVFESFDRASTILHLRCQ